MFWILGSGGIVLGQHPEGWPRVQGPSGQSVRPSSPCQHCMDGVALLSAVAERGNFQETTLPLDLLIATATFGLYARPVDYAVNNSRGRQVRRKVSLADVGFSQQVRALTAFFAVFLVIEQTTASILLLCTVHQNSQVLQHQSILYASASLLVMLS